MTLPPARTRTRAASNVRVEGVSRVGPGTAFGFSDAGDETMKSVASQSIADPFQAQYGVTQGGELSLIVPPFSFAGMQRLPHENSMLRQCIEAMVTNIEGHGWRWEYIGPEGQEEGEAAKAEKARLDAFMAAVNPDMTVDEVRSRVRRDLETLGNGDLEAIRNEKGEVVMVHHVPSSTLRMTRLDQEEVEVDVPVVTEGGISSVKMKKRFRRFVQRVGTQVVYFKEFGDPRKISLKTGKVIQTEGEEEASEIIHMSLYAPGEVYGVPRWINQLPAILGSRQAELTNLDFFRENAIPALAVLVSGGRLTEVALQEIETHLTAARGRTSMNRVVVLEAIGDDNAAAENGQIPSPKVDIKPLAGERQKDGYFLEYGLDCDKKIRSSFRLPPIFVGQSEDYSHATAKASYEVAEGQVFGPGRKFTDGIWNGLILRTYQPKFWELRSNPPRITDNEDVIAALEAFSLMGALTPNTAIDIANEYFDLELPKIEEEWGNLPFEIVKTLVGSTGYEVTGFEKVAKAKEIDQTQLGPDGKPVTNTKAKPKGKAKPAGDTTATDEQPKEKAEVLKQFATACSDLRFAMAASALITKGEAPEEEAAKVHVRVGG